MSLKQRIEERLTALGISARDASKRAQMNESFVRDILNGKAASPKASSLKALAIALETTPEWLLEHRGDGQRALVPVRFFVGAEAMVAPFSDDDALEYIEAPPGADEVTAAAIVRGNSQIPVLNPGDIVFWGDGSGSPADYIGYECVCELDTGQTLVKTVLPGSKPGLYTLTSYNSPPILDARIVQASPVLWVKRGRARV